MMKTSDFNFDLPQELIAQDPLEDRSSSRLMVLNKESGEIAHRIFHDITEYLHPGDCLVINDTKVIPARLIGTKEDTGAHIEILLLKRKENDVWETLVKPGKKCRPGARVVFGNGELKAEIVDVLEDGNRLVHFEYEGIFETASVRCLCLHISHINYRIKTVIRPFTQSMKDPQPHRQLDFILQKNC